MSSPLASTVSRPAGIRAYATLVAALAAFLAAMVVLRVPFRGYLIEARLSGRLGDGLDAAGAESWLKAAAPGVNVRVDAATSGHCDVVLQEIAPRAGEAQVTIDRVARQFAEHHVAERRAATRQAKLARLQAELQTARDTEDAIRDRLDLLRQAQSSQAQSSQTASSIPPEVLPAPTTTIPEAVMAPLPERSSPLASAESHLASLRQRLEQLRAELAALLGNCTDAHPKVITLRAQIAGLESELAAQEGSVAGGRRTEKQASIGSGGAQRWITTVDYARQSPAGDLEAALANLAAATRARQWAERQLQAEVQALSSAPGFPWTVEPARVLARVGGTPRALTLAGASLIALIAAGAMFFASAALLPRLVIQTADELAQTLTLPIVATMPMRGSPRRPRRYLAPWLVQATVHSAEIVLAAMFLALAFTMLSDRWLAGQIVGDPFGVLSEVAGRLLA